jgi:hypothetical protein
MKKVILSLVFVLATGITFMNVNSSNTEEIIIPTAKNIEVVEEFGRASDCVRWAKGLVFEFADSNNENPNDYQFYMDVYMRYYTGCLKE